MPFLSLEYLFRPHFKIVTLYKVILFATLTSKLIFTLFTLLNIEYTTVYNYDNENVLNVVGHYYVRESCLIQESR